MNHENNLYILQDKLDNRLYLVGVTDEKQYPILTANKKTARVYDVEDSGMLCAAHNLEAILVRSDC